MDFIKILLADTTFTFAAEIVLRSVLMYFLIILVLRFSGKRGVRQLSIFEIAIILSLGSAAGDAMFYEEVPIIHAVIVFAVIMALYRLTISKPFLTMYIGRPSNTVSKASDFIIK